MVQNLWAESETPVERRFSPNFPRPFSASRIFELVENWLEGSNSSYCGCLGKSFWVETPEGLVWPNLGRIGGSVKGSFLPLKDCGLRLKPAEGKFGDANSFDCDAIGDIWHDYFPVCSLAAVQLMSSFIFSFFFFQASTYPQPFHLGCFINIKVRNTDTKRTNKIQSSVIPSWCRRQRYYWIPDAYLLFCRVTRWVSLGWFQCEATVVEQLLVLFLFDLNWTKFYLGISPAGIRNSRKIILLSLS